MDILGTDLIAWADRISAASDLPNLIRRLIIATSNARVSMRSGEGTRLAGFDGMVEWVEPHNFVPTGNSVWEMGVTGEIGTKAGEDYGTRTKDPLTVVPADTTFVFVTPRRWPGKDRWVSKKRAEKIWKNVVVLDADDLEAWLSVSPAVQTWLAPHLRLACDGLQTAEQYWADWAGVTRPPLSPELVVSGWANDPAETLRQVLGGTPAAVGLASEAPHLSAAFLASVVLTGDGELGERLRVRTLVVEHRQTWLTLVNQRSHAVLVPLFSDREHVESAVRQGHHVMVPLGRRDRGQNVLRLDRQHRRAIEAALHTMALSEDRVGALATLGRRSLLALRRTLSQIPAIHQPDWATDEHVRRLIAPVLAGTWQSDHAGDQLALAALAGQPYTAVERHVVVLAAFNDPPLRRTGSTWMTVSRADAWELIAPNLIPDDLTRFRDVVLQVLGAEDPSHYLTTHERILAGIMGTTSPHSGLLREDLADALAMMAARSGTVAWPTAEDPQDFVDGVVRQLLTSATAQAWASMAWVLPWLAEASPESVLGATEQLLLVAPSQLQALFKSADHHPFASASPHVSLLWALELVAWSSQYFLRSTRLLAKLIQFSSDPNSGNTPQSSLREIFTTWYRNTSASVELKLQALDVIRTQVPDAAWPLLLSLIPGGYNHASPTHAPRWRAWGQDDGHAVLNRDHHRLVDAVIQRVIVEAGVSPQRAATLLGLYSQFSAQDRVAVQGVLNNVAAQESTAGEMIWTALREFIARQRTFVGAAWALSGTDLQPLEQMCDRYRPLDPVTRSKWLFEQQPLIGIPYKENNHEQRQAALEHEQSSALRVIAETEGWTGLERLLGALSVPEQAYSVGLTFGRFLDLPLPNLQLLYQSGVWGPSFVHGLLQGWHSRYGHDMVEALLTSPEMNTWPVADQGHLLRMLPAGDRTWRLIEQCRPEVRETYWAELPAFTLYGRTVPEVHEAFEHFLAVNRPVEAFTVARQMMQRGGQDDLSGDTWLDLLTKLAQSGPEVLTQLSHDLLEVFDKLSVRDDIDATQLAGLAWLYLPLFHFQGPPKALTQALLREPKLYAEMIALAYPALEVRNAMNATDTAQQERAWSLVRSLKGLPGHEHTPGGTADLAAWIREAREWFTTLKCLDIGDAQLGELLGSSPAGADGVWPASDVCEAVEQAASASLENGLHVGRFNMRGTTSRAVDDGGEQERVLAERYRRDAAALEGRWPRVAAVLRDLARGYERDARRNDDSADLTQDRWH
jgi:hypothetical protein